jgi:hypothetical protein
MFDTEEVVYFFYGRYFFIVYLLIIPTLIVFQKRYQGNQKKHRILLYAYLVAGLADFTSYGLGVFSPTLWRVGFGVKLLVLLVIIVVSVIYSRYLLQWPATSRWLGWLLIITAILVPLMLFEPFLAGY